MSLFAGYNASIRVVDVCLRRLVGVLSFFRSEVLEATTFSAFVHKVLERNVE